MNEPTDTFWRRTITALATTGLSLAAVGASAQGFETVFGPPATTEEGARRVAPVRFCPGGGFIAVGNTSVTAANSNVYLVRARRDGAPILERTYDLGANTFDRGLALAEASDGSGFVIVGSTRRVATGETDDVLLLKINCGGAVVWANSYASAGSDIGLSVIEAQTGSFVFGTHRGDFVVAGSTLTPGGTSDGLLLRTRSDGTLIWNRRYDGLNAPEVFRALTEALPILTTSNPTGDIVAVGQLLQPATARGYVVRVNGNDGTIGGAPQGAVIHGAGEPVGFESVVELRTPGLSGSLVMIGQTFSPPTASDVFLVRTSVNPAVVLAERRIGEPAAGTFGEEVGLDLTEVRSPAANAGRLALTGRVGRSGTEAFDAFLLIAEPSSLKPIAPGHLFGDHAERFDSGVSVAAHPNGFVLAGVSRSDFAGAGDPSDLYLINADPTGQTSCSARWETPSEALRLPAQRIQVRTEPFLQQARRQVRVQPVVTAFPACRP